MQTVGRTRIGLIVPSSNTIIETDFMRSLEPGMSLHTARMRLAENTEVAQRRMVTEFLPGAVEDIATVHPDVVIFACTTAGAIIGPEGERQLIQDIGHRTGAPVVSMNDAVNSAIETHRPSAVAVITPYVDELNAHIRRGLEGRGIVVAHIAGLGIVENFQVAGVTPDEIVSFAERELSGKAFDLLYVPCANWRALEARGALQARFGTPVVTSDSATIDAAFSALRVKAGAT